jgi:pyruvate dehydrogenase E2 component (dihydrolipoamide acetyltransferase)
MAVSVNMPKLGVEMVSGKIIEWKVGEGGNTKEKDILLILETEKVTYDMESPASGILHILKSTDIDIPVGDPIGVIAASQQEYQQIVTGGAVKEGAPREAARPAEVAAPLPKAAAVSQGPEGKFRISPVARKLAEEKGVNISTIRGTGPDGRITKEDVLRVLETKKEEKVPVTAVSPPVGIPSPGVPQKRLKERLPVKGLRKVIAERLYKSLQTTAQMSEMGEMEVGELVRMREQFLSEEKSLGLRISYTDLIVKAVALTLKSHPMLNASMEGDEIILWDSVNIGVAVATDQGLIVPVIHDADKKSLIEISRKLSELVEKARKRALLPDELSRGTFTITNFGSYGGYMGTPILNPPEVAILGIGAILRKPVVKGDEIVIGHVMGFGLTVDHRVIDGAVGGEFTQDLRKILAKPAMMFISS